MKPIIFLFFALCFTFGFSQTKSAVPEGFVIIDEFIPDITIELRYATSDNFVGQPIDGYEARTCIMSLDAAKALKNVQEELYDNNLCLKVYDAYRPQRAVNHFMRWAKDLNDTINKPYYYPEVDKKDLFKEEYIATRSRHSSGSTVDITLVDGFTGKELDMGSPWDYFGERSWVNFENITEQQRANRVFLQFIMAKHGFRNYPKEWWHFTLRAEPFAGQYFDFVLE